MKKYKFLQFTFITLFILNILQSCVKNNTADNIKEYNYTGFQRAHFDSKIADSNGQYHYTNWDSTYQDQMKVSINATQRLMTFTFNKSNHLSSPDTTIYIIPIQHNNYSIPLGYRVRYDFRFQDDSLFAEYFNLNGLTDTFYVNKRLLFSGRRLN
jgi:hypothetical protein